MKINRFVLVGFVFGFILSASAALAQEDTGFITKIKRFFNGSNDSTATAEIQKEEKPLTGASDAPFQAEETAEEKPTDRFAPTFDFSERIIGNADAPIKAYVFTSLTCGHCSSFHNHFLPQIVEKYVDTGKMNISLVDFPLEERALIGTLISKCLSGERYFAFMDTLYQHQNKWMGSNNLTQALLPYARLAGMPEQKMIACAEDTAAAKEISRQRNQYVAKYKINATPTIVLVGSNGRKKHITGVPASMEAFDSNVAEVSGD